MTLTSPHPFENGIERAWPAAAWAESHILLAVSGGADSVAMLRATAAVKERRGGRGQIHVAHLNHGLRGAESEADAEWLKTLCTRLQLPLKIGQADVRTIANSHGDGLEAAGRTARYDFLRQSAESLGARFVAVAHTADDQVETVLHRILRGSGIDGLGGIPPTRPLSASVSLVRPLLAMRRSDVLAYLAATGQDFRTDASNVDLRWTRNRLRNELLPALRQYFNADVDAALLRLATQAQESQLVIKDVAERIASECVTHESVAAKTARRIRIDCRSLADQPSLIVREICKGAWTTAGWPLQAMGFVQWQQLAAMVHSVVPTPATNLPGNVHVHREGDFLILQADGLP